MMVTVRYCLKILWNQHCRLPLLIFTALLISSSAWAQTNQAISRDFDKEMADYITGRADTSVLSTAYSLIPSWIIKLLPEQQDTLFIFGISDPGLIDSVARRQAILRALTFGAMADVTDCEHFSDFYSQEKESGTVSKYEEIYRFSADAPVKSASINIINYTILPSTEAIVLMGIPRKHLQDDSLKNIQIEAFLYNNEADIMYGNKLAKKVDISIRKRNIEKMLVIDACSFYQINGKATGMRCSFPQSQAVYDRFDFYYSSGDSLTCADSTGIRGATCKQGLWIAYVSQIMDQLSLQAKMLSKESQSLRDKTEDTSTELVRERSRIRLTWTIKAIDIHDDKMWVNMTTSKF